MMNLNDNDFNNLLNEIENEDSKVFNKLASDTEEEYSDKVNPDLLKKYLDLTGDTIEMFNKMAVNYITIKFGNAGTDKEHIAYIEGIMKTELNTFEDK